MSMYTLLRNNPLPSYKEMESAFEGKSFLFFIVHNADLWILLDEGGAQRKRQVLGWFWQSIRINQKMHFIFPFRRKSEIKLIYWVSLSIKVIPSCISFHCWLFDWPGEKKHNPLNQSAATKVKLIVACSFVIARAFGCFFISHWFLVGSLYYLPCLCWSLWQLSFCFHGSRSQGL